MSTLAENKLLAANKIPGSIYKAQVGKFTLNYLKAGSGPPLILIHGINIGWGQWYPNLEHLSKANTIYALDLPGAGNSSRVNYSVINWISDYVETIERFVSQTGIGKVSLVGHSSGGWMALKIAERKNIPIDKMILISPLGFTDQLPFKFYPITFKLLANLIARTVAKLSQKNLDSIIRSLTGKLLLSPEFLEYYYDSLKFQGGEKAHPFSFINQLCRPFRLRKEISGIDPTKVDRPTLLFLGEKDSLLKFEKIRDSVTIIPMVKLRILPEVGHVAALERPTLFNSEVSEFL